MANEWLPNIFGTIRNTFRLGKTNPATIDASGMTGARTLVLPDASCDLWGSAKRRRESFTALTDGATITVDWSLGNKFSVTLGGNRTLAFTNVTAGQIITLRLLQDATGSRTVTWPSSGVTFRWAGGSAPTLITTASKWDRIAIECVDATEGALVFDATLVMTEGVSSGGSGTPATTISSKTSAYTVVAADHGSIINCTSGTFTVSLTAAATLGSGFSCWILNSASLSSQVITIDPNAGETISGLATLTLYRGERVELICDGSSFALRGGKLRGYASNFDPAATPSVATGDTSLAIGIGTSASGNYATAVGHDGDGVASVASGIGSLALNGGTANSQNAVAIGSYSTARSNQGSWARANGRVTTLGDAQFRFLVLRGQSTSATPVVLTSDGAAAAAANIVRMPNNSCYFFTAIIVGHRTDVVGTYAAYKIEGVVTRGANAGSTAIRGTNVVTTFVETDATFNCTATADATNGGLIITATGAASKTVTWSCKVETVEATS